MKFYYLLFFTLFIVLTGCTKPDFNGNRTGNDEQFIMNYTVLNTTKTHTMPLQAGDKLQVEIINSSGRLDVKVTDTSGNTIYVGNDASTNRFVLEIQQTDTYTFTVTGKNAKGSISFILVK